MPQVGKVIFSAIVGLGLLGAGYLYFKKTPQQEKTNQIAVMSFNLRFADDKMPHAWSLRRPVVARCLKEANPDIIGTQEGLFEQLNDMRDDLPEYESIGLGRLGGSHGEFMEIFYKKNRLKLLEYDHFWLSDNPQLIASKWNHKHPRMVTWIRFRDLKDQTREFLVFNTHFDHQRDQNPPHEAREKSAALLLIKIKEINAQNLPVIVVGDFNEDSRPEAFRDKSRVEGKALQTVTEGSYLKNTWDMTAQKPPEAMGTSHQYIKLPSQQDQASLAQYRRIDWILVHGEWKVGQIVINTCSDKDQYPSDHFPIQAQLEFPAKR